MKDIESKNEGEENGKFTEEELKLIDIDNKNKRIIENTKNKGIESESDIVKVIN